MLRYVFKFMSDILPSVIATIIGAYIVNHYIVTKPDAPAAAIASKKAEDAKLGDVPALTASIPESAKATGVDKTATETSIAEKPVAEKAADKSSDKPAGRHQPMPRDKTIAKPAAPSAPNPVTTASIPAAAPIEPAAVQEERRDANDLARAAIERLRTSSAPARAQETSRVQDAPRAPDAQHAAGPLQPLPPAVTIPATTAVSLPPAADTAMASPMRPADPSAARSEDPQRPSPPADIPSRPIDLRAEAAAPARTSVAEEMLMAAKSVFHAVLPR